MLKKLQKWLVRILILFLMLDTFNFVYQKLEENKNLIESQQIQIDKLNDKIETLNEEKEDLAESCRNLEQNYYDLLENYNSLKNSIDWLTTQEIVLANEDNSFKSYMSYKAITDSSSKQYNLLYSGNITICEDGLLRDNDGFIAVAIGTYYTRDVGDRFIATLSSGKKIKLIALDIKADEHTVDGANQYLDGSMIEFIVDTYKISMTYNKASLMGNFDYSDEFNGNIVKIEKVIN